LEKYSLSYILAYNSKLTDLGRNQK